MITHLTDHFKPRFTDDDAREIYDWACGFEVPITLHFQDIPCNSKISGLSPSILLYAAELHAYVNQCHFDFDCFLEQLGSYFKLIVSFLSVLKEFC